MGSIQTLTLSLLLLNVNKIKKKQFHLLCITQCLDLYIMHRLSMLTKNFKKTCNIFFVCFDIRNQLTLFTWEKEYESRVERYDVTQTSAVGGGMHFKLFAIRH